MDPYQGNLGVGPLARRTTGGFALSIATSLAFESLFEARQPPYDPQRQIPQKIDVKHYDELWINLATLYRNIIGSLPDKMDYYAIKPADIYHALVFELEMILSLMSHEGHDLCKPMFYYCGYESLYKRKFPPAVRLREDKTDGQKYNTHMLTETMKLFFKNIESGPFFQFNSEILPKRPTTSLIITHVPHDLLSYNNFKRLDLLESHTGKLKGRNLWYTKFNAVGSEELNTLPFIRQLLYLFGDHIIFQPTDIRFRKLILEISRNRRWTPMTTEQKVKMDLDLDIKERYLFDLYKQL